MALKCSDLGHLTSKQDVHKQWVLLLEEVRGSVKGHSTLKEGQALREGEKKSTKQRQGFLLN